MTEQREKIHMQMLGEREKKWRSTYKNMFDQIKELKMCSGQSSTANIATTYVQQHKKPSENIDITKDDRTDEIILDKIRHSKPSCSKNVKCSFDTTSLKVNIILIHFGFVIQRINLNLLNSF
jgi:poly-beta-hydroxyalkanoate depolymerase